MRSLFEYLDVNNDGKITHQCLMNGLARLRNNKTINEQTQTNATTTNEDRNSTDSVHTDLSEYSIEELIRSVPHATDGQEGITLKAFLEAEATLLPHLTNLKLLQ